jgi:hypothetical protein
MKMTAVWPGREQVIPYFVSEPLQRVASCCHCHLIAFTMSNVYSMFWEQGIIILKARNKTFILVLLHRHSLHWLWNCIWHLYLPPPWEVSNHVIPHPNIHSFLAKHVKGIPRVWRQGVCVYGGAGSKVDLGSDGLPRRFPRRNGVLQCAAPLLGSAF